MQRQHTLIFIILFIFFKMKSILKVSLITLIVIIGFSSCKKDRKIDVNTEDPSIDKPDNQEKFGTVSIVFSSKAGNSDLELDSVKYTNAHGDSLTISKFKYYLSNFKLIKDDGTVYKQEESYHLINRSNGKTYTVELENVPVGTYNSLNYLLGVDSARNTSGAQTGALDPALNMFWSWNQGYIFLLFEGTSPASQSFNQALSFHIGGFTLPYNCIRSISPSFGSQNVLVTEGHNSTIFVNTDVLKMFESPHLIKFSQVSESLGGAIGSSISDNAANMFSIASIQN